MRSQVVVPVLWAVLGGGVTAASLVAAGVVTPGTGSTVVQQATPLLTSGPVGGTAAGDVYRDAAGGVVGITARALPVAPSAFDTAERRSDGTISGSGFVLDGDGLVVTAAHLVRSASAVEVDLGPRTVPGRVVGVDEGDDLALLRVHPGNVQLHPLELGDSDAVQVGDPAIAIGRAAGMEPTLVTAAVAARQPKVVASGGGTISDALQVDAPLDGADCGGPLLNASGQVTGVNTRMVTAQGDTVDLAVPANTVRRMLPQLTNAAMKVVTG
jgi:S1-C subfamily serine protease